MSEVALTAAFGPAGRHSDSIRQVKVFGQLLVGGSGMFAFTNLDDGKTIRVRSDEAGFADTLMAGFVLAEHDKDFADAEAEVLNDVLFDSNSNGGVVELTRSDAIALARAAQQVAVSGVVTLLGGPDELQAGDFGQWNVRVVESAT